MKALAILATCLVAALPVGFASPSFAAPGFAPHVGPAPHPRAQPHPGPVPMGGRHGWRHGHGGEGVGILAPDALGASPAYDYGQPAADVLPTPDILPPPVILAPQAASYCAPPEPPRPRHTGPRIIYIGHQPRVDGPTVIYGTD